MKEKTFFLKLLGDCIRPIKMLVVRSRFRENKLFPALEQLSLLYDSAREPSEVLCVGDSVLERVSRYDNDKRNLGQMLKEQLGDRFRCDVISQTAYSIKTFYPLLSALQKMRSSPRVIIIPVNIRSFSPQWFNNPVWQYEKEIEAINRYLGSPGKDIPRAAEGHRGAVSFEEFDSLPVEYVCSSFERAGHFRLIVEARPQTKEQLAFRLKQIFIFHYMHPLREEHPMLGMLRAMLQCLVRMRISTMFYFTPVNHAAGVRHVGPEFIHLHESNVATIKRVIQEFVSIGLAAFVDYSTLFDSSYFFHENEPTEHLNEYGRQNLATKISEDIRAFVGSPG